jgi:hypothetical protein
LSAAESSETVSSGKFMRVCGAAATSVMRKSIVLGISNVRREVRARDIPSLKSFHGRGGEPINDLLTIFARA